MCSKLGLSDRFRWIQQSKLPKCIAEAPERSVAWILHSRMVLWLRFRFSLSRVPCALGYAFEINLKR